VPTGWRIVKAKHAANAFDGEGARINGGRWNSPGTSVVYTSESRALATLELLVHLNDSTLLAKYVLIPCTFAYRHAVRVEDLGPLPRDWAAYPASAALQAIGDPWARRGSPLVLSVPSAVTHDERNYVLNPAHAGFRFVKIGVPVPLRLDERLLGRRRKP
jgi:RES domain-containing protein